MTDHPDQERLAHKRLLHVAKAIWSKQYEDEFPPQGTIGYAIAMEAAIAATEALAEAMEMEETARLLSTPKNADRLVSAIAQLDAGALTASQHREEVLRGALEEAASWFDEYAEGHLAKGAADKALRNKTRANILRTALRSTEGEKT